MIKDFDIRKKWWEIQQEKKDINNLTGSNYLGTIQGMQIVELIKPQAHVLEIGVGIGLVTKGLYENGCIVSALDISELALNNVKEYCENLYNVERIEELPSNYFDVMICVNVVQHIPTDLLLIELKHIIRSLKKDTGIFAVQIVTSNKGEDTGINISYKGDENGGYFRTPEYFEKMIENLGGKCHKFKERKLDILAGSTDGLKIIGDYYYHIRRQ